MPDAAKKYYRCIIPQFPRAKIAIFLKDDNGDLEYKGIMKDRNFIDLSQRRGYGAIYNNIAKGDSGGPVMRKINIESINWEKIPPTKYTEKRNVIVGIISTAFVSVTERTDTRCIAEVTKVTKDIIEWIKKMETGDYSIGKL